ncbi:proteasome assembly chaperone family protein, partial [Candidatus Woesearchaeota archaeon]|nr:proteasome assembly chaperone family protein [Candidatus Woesearchaeota archaeon]
MMPTLLLSKRPKNVTILEGFPGFGLVATITTEYLLDHLKCEKIGSLYFEEMPASVAIHAGKIVEPVSFHYSKGYNLVIVHAITPVMGIEWKAAEVVNNLAKELTAKELICVEGVGSPEKTGERVFYYTNKDAVEKKLKTAGLTNLGEGIIIGVTGALMQKSIIPVTCLFAETHSNLPDSKAAANVIGVLDKYLGLDVDPKPLFKKAEEFE